MHKATANFAPAQTPTDPAAELVERILWRLVAAEIGLHEIPSWLLAWYTVAYEQGRESRESEIRFLNSECDRLWRAAFAPIKIKPARMSYADRLRQQGQLGKANEVEKYISEFKFEVTR